MKKDYPPLKNATKLEWGFKIRLALTLPACPVCMTLKALCRLPCRCTQYPWFFSRLFVQSEHHDVPESQQQHFANASKLMFVFELFWPYFLYMGKGMQQGGEIHGCEAQVLPAQCLGHQT